MIIVHTDEPPTVEIDSTVPAAYIRFSKAKVVSTQPIETDDDMIINVDLDELRRVVGLELVGVEEFSINELFEKVHVIGIPAEILRRTRYVPAQPAGRDAGMLRRSTKNLPVRER